MTEIVRQVAHRAVENTQTLNPGERGRAHLNEPEQELTFDDIIDIINPLHHLPLVGMLYREFSGDKIKPAMQIAGGLAYGGPTGFLGSVGQVLFEAIFGDDIGGTVMGMIGGEDDATAAPAQLAEATFEYRQGNNRS